MPNQILSNVRVIDIGRYIAGPFCAALLADLGAEVIRVEPVDGGDDRFVMPVSQSGDGALHFQVNREKRSLALDIASAEGREVCRRLIASADVVVVNLPPKARAKLGLSYDELRALKPEIILTTVTAYGTKGTDADRVGFDATGQALSGAIYLTGLPGQPFRSAVSYVDYGTAIAAAFGTLAALISRMRTGVGQHVEASLLSTALTMTNPMLIEEALDARSRAPTGNRSPISGPSDLFATKDGWIFVQVIGQDMFERWVDLVGAEDLRGDPRFVDDMTRGKNGAILSDRTGKWCADHSTQECLSKLHRARVPGYAVLSPAQALHAPEIASGGLYEWQQNSQFGHPIPIVRPLVHFSRAVEAPSAPAPGLGVDTSSILGELGYHNEEIHDLLKKGVARCAARTCGPSSEASVVESFREFKSKPQAESQT